MRIWLLFVFLLVSSISFAQFNLDSLIQKSIQEDINSQPKEYRDSLYFSFFKSHNVKLDSTDNDSLFRYIFDRFGTPYKYGDTSKFGMDCSAFVDLVYLHVYKRNLQRNSAKIYAINCDSISKDSLKQGDLVFFNIKTKGISHLGIYLKDGIFIHSSSTYGVRFSRLDENYYSKYYWGSGRVK